jgi:hypothetical protein
MRLMRGGALAHLMYGTDGHFYVVKFRDNPQHSRSLASELLATRLARRIGLPVPEPQVIHVAASVIAGSSALAVQTAGQAVPCCSGSHFGSRYAIDPWRGQVFDYLPQETLLRARNLATFVGALAFDRWTCNADSRQAVFWKLSRQQIYSVSFIDQGACFNGAEWSFHDSPCHGIYCNREVYWRVRGWESFEPWLSRIEAIDDAEVWEHAKEIPPEWYDGKRDALDRLIATLHKRRSRIRELIAATHRSTVNPFNNWLKASVSAA